MKRPRILVVEDDASVVRFIALNLRAEGYEPILARDGAAATVIAAESKPDLLILDINLPSMDGFEVCRLVRESSMCPIIVLSARGALSDKVRALNLGADDYVTKPFAVEELLARVKAALRRSAAVQSTSSLDSFSSRDLFIDFNERRVTVHGREVALTPTEFGLLQCLALNANKILTQRTLLTMVWGPEYSGEGDYVRAYIRRLRKKLEDDATKAEYIITVPGVGYRLRA